MTPKEALRQALCETHDGLWDIDAIIAHLPEGYEVAKHIHEWAAGPTYATIPPIESRVCTRCGEWQEYKPGEWHTVRKDQQ